MNRFILAMILIASLTGCKIIVEPIAGTTSRVRGGSYGQQRGPQVPQIVGYHEVIGRRWVSARGTPGCDNGRRSQARPQSVMYYGGGQQLMGGSSQYCPPQQRSPYMSSYGGQSPYGQMGGFQQYGGGYGGQFRPAPRGPGYRDSRGVYHP